MESITTDQRAKSLYTLPPANALRREGRPVRPWREAHSLSPCPDGQRQRLRTRKPDSIARVLHPRSDDTQCCPADSSWACPPGSRRIDVYSYKVPARPEAKSLSPVQCCCQVSHGAAAGTVIGNSALMDTYVSDEYRLFQRFSHCIPVLFPGFQRHNAQIPCQFIEHILCIPAAPVTVAQDGAPRQVVMVFQNGSNSEYR